MTINARVIAGSGAADAGAACDLATRQPLRAPATAVNNPLRLVGKPRRPFPVAEVL